MKESRVWLIVALAGPVVAHLGAALGDPELPSVGCAMSAASTIMIILAKNAGARRAP